jgi:hypothetical protein
MYQQHTFHGNAFLGSGPPPSFIKNHQVKVLLGALKLGILGRSEW